MTRSIKLSPRMTRLRVPGAAALVLALVACADTTAPDPITMPEAAAMDTLTLGADASVGASSFAGGIPMGLFALPTSWFGRTYNGAKQTIGPKLLTRELAAIKARGGRVVLMMAGSEVNYRDGRGHFSLTKWKQRIDRFRHINFTSYINDGTIIAHYLIDEPQDKTNWRGIAISPATVEQMGQYSKQIWPSMATVVRTEPKFFPGRPRYIDAAWAQYLARMGDVNAYIRRNVADAQKRSMALVVGMNIRYGGTPHMTAMSASEVERYGSALLSSTYPCAFINWQFMSSYFSSSSMKGAMDMLRRKAQSRPARSCRG